MKSIVLRDHEVTRLASAGSVLVWRVLKGQGGWVQYHGCLTGDCPHNSQAECDAHLQIACPFGATGETRFVKEAHRFDGLDPKIALKMKDFETAQFRADEDDRFVKWRPSTHMPEWASRFRVTLTVSCRQIQSVTDTEADHSGISETPFWTPKEVDENPKPIHEWKEPYWDDQYFFGHYHRVAFRKLINARHPGSWERNDWYWVVECKEVK